MSAILHYCGYKPRCPSRARGKSLAKQPDEEMAPLEVEVEHSARAAAAAAAAAVEEEEEEEEEEDTKTREARGTAAAVWTPNPTAIERQGDGCAATLSSPVVQDETGGKGAARMTASGCYVYSKEHFFFARYVAETVVEPSVARAAALARVVTDPVYVRTEALRASTANTANSLVELNIRFVKGVQAIFFPPCMCCFRCAF